MCHLNNMVLQFRTSFPWILHENLPATATVARVNDRHTLDLFASLLVLARRDLSLPEKELENRSTYLACAIHLVIVLQGASEQWNSRALANCHRESVEFAHPVSFLSYLHKARRNFLVYLEGTLWRGVFPQQKGLVCRFSDGPSSIYLFVSCDTVIPSGYQREKGKIFYRCLESSSTLIMGRSPNKHPLGSTTGGHLFWGCPLPGVLLSTKHMEKFLSVSVAQLTFMNIPPTK